MSGGNPGLAGRIFVRSISRSARTKKIEHISYVGEGCTISREAGASFMTSRLAGKTLAEVEEMDYDIGSP